MKQSFTGGFIGRIQENTSEVSIRNCAAYGTIKTGYAGDYNDTATIYYGRIFELFQHGHTDSPGKLPVCRQV